MVWNATGDRPFMLNDPMLNGIYHLRSGSPAIDAGDPLHIYNDADGSIGDLGAHGGPGSDWAPQPVIVFPPIMGVEEDRWRESIPQSVVIDAYPNPFNAAVQMNWFAPDVVEIYDTRGQKIWVSDYGTSAVWSTSNQPSGVYICRLRFSAAPGQKLILQR